MMEQDWALLAQHVIAIAVSLGAGVWLIARSRSSKGRGEGPCASCAAASYRKTVKRPEASPSRVMILKK